MNLKTLAAALLMAAAAGSSFAKTENLGTLSDATTSFSNTFAHIGSGGFADTYTFTLAGAGNVYGGVTTFELLDWFGDIHLQSLSLSGGGLATTRTDLSPGAFSFNNLVAGTYSLVLKGSYTGVDVSGYHGRVETDAVAPVSAPVPEPEALVMMGMGLGVVGFLARRRRARVG